MGISLVARFAASALGVKSEQSATCPSPQQRGICDLRHIVMEDGSLCCRHDDCEQEGTAEERREKKRGHFFHLLAERYNPPPCRSGYQLWSISQGSQRCL